MTKLCPRGKAAAKRKFAVYPSAYANAYASKICAGKIKDPSGKKRKDWGPKKAALGLFAASKMGKDKVKKLVTKRASMATPNTYLATQYFNSGKEVKTSEYNGSYIRSEIDGKKISNKSLEAYYGDMIDV